jgi:4-amino-4-deoxy-L-arabinose transferase-like glycosyltransferase
MTVVFYKKPIFWIIVLAFFLRLAGVFEGLPAIHNSTEHHLAKFTLKMAANKTLDPGFYIYPSFYQYILVVLYGYYFIIGFMLGIFKDSYDFAVRFLIDPSAIFIIGRLLSVFVSTSSVYFLYKLVKKISDNKCALLSAIFLSISYYSIHLGQLATQDTLLIFFTILALHKFWDSLENQNTLHLLYSGIFTGLAIASKYNAGFLGFGLLFTVYYSWKIHQNKFLKRLFLATIGLLLSLIITNPYSLIAPEKYLQAYVMVTEQMYYGTSIYRGINYLWEIIEIISHEWLLGIMFFISTIYAISKKNKYNHILLIVILPTFFYVGSWPKKGIDYLLVCWPIFIMFSVFFIEFIFDKANNNKLKKMLIIVLILPSFLFNMYQLVLKFIPDTRQLASEWMLENMSNDDKICYDKNGYDLTLIDIQRFTDYGPSAKTLPPEMKNRLHQYLDMERNVDFISSIEWVKNIYADSISQDYSKQQGAVRWKSLGEILTEGADWLIINEDYKQTHIQFSDIKIPQLDERIKNMKKFYNEIDAFYNPVIKFSNSFWRNGPEIIVYNLSSRNTN